jgi:predicted SnoaL-like aldol condensation-catalyzing enzyme
MCSQEGHRVRPRVHSVATDASRQSHPSPPPATRNNPRRLVAIALSTMALCVAICPAARADIPDNVHTAKRVFLENMADGRFERLDEISGRNFVAHGASADYTLEQDSAATKSWRAAMPDLKVAVERTVADKDLVAVHWKVVGTNTVSAGGMPGNGARIGIEGMSFFRFSSGRIVEEWTIVDIATLRK